MTSLALAPDNWTLLSGSRDKTVHMWDLRTHAKTATIPIHEAVEGLLACLVSAWFDHGMHWSCGCGAYSRCHHRLRCLLVSLRSTSAICLPTGVVALPVGAAFPGVKVSSKGGGKGDAAGKRPVYFVTAGERGRLRIWR